MSVWVCVPILFCLFKNLFRIITGLPLLLWTKQNCGTHIQCFTPPLGESRIHIIRGYLHMHPSCDGSSREDKVQIKPASVSLAPTRRKHVTSTRLGNPWPRPWQVGSPSGVWHLGRAGSPSTQMWPPSFFFSWKIPSHGSSVLTLGLAQALCPGLDWRPTTGAPCSRVTSLSQEISLSPGQTRMVGHPMQFCP